MSGESPIRLGVVGCGRVTETCHLPALAPLREQIRVVALADSDEHSRRRVGGMFDIGRTFDGVESMLRESGSDIDAVAVCAPAAAHADAAIAALTAGKHVLIEKPLALTLDDADRIVAAAAAAHPAQKVVLGFNLRHHRLVRAAKQLVAAGHLGEIQLVRTIWTSGLRTRMRLPAWRNHRTSGGGVLCEIAIHHIDLVRHLLGAEIREVFAQSTHGEGDDQVATLSLRTGSGVTVCSAFSELAGDANELEVIGSAGRLSFSLYRFDSFRFTPTGSYGGRGAHLRETLRQLPKVWPILRRGGDFKESYRQQWLSFADVVRTRGEPAATAEDGREALRVVLAAGASAELGKAVPVSDAPRRPQPVTTTSRPAAASPDAAPATQSTNEPALSAIIATPGGFGAIRRTIRHLGVQSVREQIELVIICSDKATLKLDESEVAGFWGHQVIEIGEMPTVAVSNAAGVRAASAPLVVFCEDHAFPQPQWAQSLILAHRGPYTVVGPVIHNANPDTLVSRADCLITYGPWLEPLRPCEPHHLPGHNSAYKRDVLLGYGERLALMLEAESVLQWDLRAKGHRLYLDPSARLAHTNFAKLGIWTSVQLHAGRNFAGTRALSWPVWKRLAYAGGSPLIPLVRLKRVLSQSRRLSGSQRIGPALLATLLYGLALDGVGQMIGYLFGVGRFDANVYEFYRTRHITEGDRQQLAAAEPTPAVPASTQHAT